MSPTNDMKARLFVDMDGTLAVWKQAACFEDLLQPGYFRDLPPYQTVLDAVKILCNTKPELDVYALSAYMPENPYINASGECYVIYIDGEWDFKAAGTLTGDELRQTVKAIDQNHQLSQDFIIGDGDTQCNFGKAFAVGDSKTDNSKREGLAIKVSELQAEPATWRVVPMSTSALKRGEIAKSIAPASAMYNASAIDLSTCSAPLDITENGWFIAGAEKAKVAQDGAGTDAVKHDDAPALPLITTAKIAGSNVNDAGCTPVVRVTYSIIPMFETGDTQTATAGGVSSNR